MQAAAETLIELAADPNTWGPRSVCSTTLHTWWQKLEFHPHVHCVVTGADRVWTRATGSSVHHFFLPERVLGRCSGVSFRRDCTPPSDGEASLPRQARRSGRPGQFNDLLSQTVRTDWAVYAKPPWGGPATVLKDLARYTHKTAISNRRLLSLEDGQIISGWKRLRPRRSPADHDA